MKKLFLLVVGVFVCYGNSLLNLPYIGIEVEYKNTKNETKKVSVERVIKDECSNIDLSPESIWNDTYVNKEIHQNCKKTFVTTKGIIQPIAFNEKIKTVGELEVLEFLKNKVIKEPNKYALVDSRPYEWYEQKTIPGAVNIPYDELEINELVTKKIYQTNLNKLGVQLNNNKLDFTNAKTIILFCNGAWCSQSSQAMKTIVKLGYPQEKIFWYRGGIQSWTSMSLSTINLSPQN